LLGKSIVAAALVVPNISSMTDLVLEYLTRALNLAHKL
jgi:hypothetical protein